MANLVSFISLRTDVRQQTNAEGDGHISEDELKRWVNKGVQRYHGITMEHDEDRLLKRSTLVTTSGVFEYAMPSDFYQIRGVDREDNGGPWTLHSFRFENRNDRKSAGFAATAFFLPRYTIINERAELLFDIDPGNADYTLHYLFFPQDLLADGDTIDGLFGCDDYVIAYASSKVRRKRDENPAEEHREMARIEQDLQKQSVRRHADGFDTPPKTRTPFSSYPIVR